MAKRQLRMVKRTQPMIGVCERCNAQFKGDSEQSIQAAFTDHSCKPLDSSQNALRIVREATEDK